MTDNSKQIPLPIRLFLKCTYLGHGPAAERRAKQIEKVLIRQYYGYFAFIDYDKELGWVFHTLLTPDGLKSVKEISNRFAQAPFGSFSEAGLEDEVCRALDREGQIYERQVRLSAGIADIVTPTAIYELKDRLTRRKLFTAIGQVMIYRQEINHQLDAYVIGRSVAPDIHDVVKIAAQLNIEVREWKS